MNFTNFRMSLIFTNLKGSNEKLFTKETWILETDEIFYNMRALNFIQTPYPSIQMLPFSILPPGGECVLAE